MANKVQERIYGETAAALLRVDWLLVDIPEPLDFEVCTAVERFGLEVTLVFVDQEERFGSPAKKTESQNTKAIWRLASRYYSLGAPPIFAKVLGSIPAANTMALVEFMATAAPTYPAPSKTIHYHGLKIFMTPLPVSFKNYSRWIFTNDRVGWTKPVKASDLQRSIDRKGANLPFYKNKYADIELLLVADRTFKSGMLVEPDELVVNNPGFRAIYFMSYPDSITTCQLTSSFQQTT